MVQYVLTPWRDRQELLLVKQQFYASPSWLGLGYGEISVDDEDDNDNDGDQDSSLLPDDAGGEEDGGDGGGGGGRGGDGSTCGAPKQQHQQDQEKQHQQELNQKKQKQRHQLRQAVARVSMWMQRGNCPHMVESTALLTAAMLSDEDADMAVNDDHAASAAYAVRAAYSAAFSRFVTGLLDGHQDKQRKQSMYSVAKTIGLPATFVELRHQSTHEQLPSLAKLRTSARKALTWIWDYYWKHLTGNDSPIAAGDPSSRIALGSASNATSTIAAPSRQDPCEEALLRYLREENDGDDEVRRRRRLGLLSQWDMERLTRCLDGLRGSLPGNQAYLKCQRLSHELKDMVRQGFVENQSLEEPPLMQTDNTTERDEHSQNPGQYMSSNVPPTSTSAPASELDTGWNLYQGPWKPKPIGMV